MRNKITALAAAAALAAGGVAQSQATPTAAEGYVPAVRAETLKSGWPHVATNREGWAITVRVAKTYRPGTTRGVTAACTLPRYAHRWSCVVTRHYVNRNVRFRVTVLVQPLGFYRITGRKP